MRARALVLAAVFVTTACDGYGGFSDADVARAAVGARLPASFMLGAATAPHQIEGGNRNDWSRWEEGRFADGTPHIHGDERSGRAAGSFELWRDDVAALVALGANAYRLGIEWSRVEPEPGRVDELALARYREMFVELRALGIEPVVTLFHFTLPLWLADAGGFESAQAIEAFAAFARLCGERFGDVVDTWVTVNEPNVYALQGYSLGVWPPGVNDSARQTRVYAALLHGHAAAAKALRRYDLVDADGDGAATSLGLAHHMRLFQPASPALLDQTITALTDDYFNDAVPRALSTGRIRLSIPGTIDLDERDADLVGSADFLGVNYYTRDFIRADLSQPTLSQQYVPAGRPKNDLGWDIYPQGLLDVLVRLGRFGWPLLVTENGIADAADAARPAYLRAHLFAVEEALARGVGVVGYLHWSLIDNFEWAEGYSGRFGLFAIDFADPTLRRVPRESAAVFREIVENRRARSD